MKSFVKRTITIALLGMASLMGLQAHAQTLAKNTDWIEKQLNKLVTDDDEHDTKLNGKKSTPKFAFDGCQMNMILDTRDEDVSVGMNIAWQLKDVRKVSYKPGKNGQYVLVLDVPTDKVKMSMSLGGFAGSFNADDKDRNDADNTSSFTLDTMDEALVRQLKQRLDASVQLCRKERK